MRIRTLHLRAFGPFSGARLNFTAEPSDLQVIYGRNEAGKSSALRALGAALFGIPGQTPDNFLHEYTALRVGLGIENVAGDQIAFVRRKGRARTLWNVDETESFADDALHAFLTNVDAEEFARVFGLDHVRLREGGERLLDAAEGADDVIVGAALGVQGLREVAAALEQEASNLFSTRGSKRAINAAIAQWNESQKSVRADSLAKTTWEKTRRDAARAAAERDRADERVAKLRERERELEFVRRNRPRVARLDYLVTEMADLETVPDLAADFAERHRNARDGAGEKRVLRDRARADEREAAEKLAGLPGDFAFLDAIPEVVRLQELSVVTAKGMQDRSRREAEARAAAGERDRVAKSLGLATPVVPGAVEELRLALGVQQRCLDLLQERAALVGARKDGRERLSRLRRDREAAARRLGEATAVPERGALERAVTEARRLGDADAVIAGFRGECGTDEAEIEAALARLASFQGNAADLEARPVPGAELLRDFRQRFDALADEENQARRTEAEARERRDRLVLDVERLATREEIPSEDDLQRVRGCRDEQWRLIRGAWLDGADVDAAAAALDPDRPLAEAFERSLGGSDDVADRLRRESQRVAELAAKRHEVEELDTRLARLEEAGRERDARREELDGEWAAAWADSGFVAGRPAAMQDALLERSQLLTVIARRRATATKLDEACARMQTARDGLVRALAATLGSAEPVSDERLGPVLEDAEAQLADLVARADARAKDEAEVARLDGEITGAEEADAANERDLEAWEEGFAKARRGLPWREGDPPEAITRTFAEVSSLVQQHDKEAELLDRIASIDRDGHDLERQVETFLAAHAPEMPKRTPAETLSRLGSLGEQRQREKQDHETATGALRQAGKRLRDAEADLSVIEGTLADLANEAGVASADDLPDVVERGARKRGLVEERRRLEQELLGEGCPIDRTRERVVLLADHDVDAELEPLRAQVVEAEQAAAAQREAATEAKLAFEALHAEGGAAESAARAAATGARLREDVQRYVRLLLAGELLGSAVERFRAQNEAPLLTLASRHLERLTRGAYGCVETDIDDKSRPFFLVRESGGSAAKNVQQLSDGTRDQLHLALVLGSLEHRFRAGVEPMPLVLDDVLVHFDDERSQATLETLAEFSKITQVLLFTHHDKIREQAQGVGAVIPLENAG